MSNETLGRYIQQYIDSQAKSQEIQFAWQGGEPTLMGRDFFQRAVAMQQWHCPPGKRITNAIQTNGTLLDNEWCQFLADHNFLVGISIDGPEDLHDIYRVDKGNKPTFKKVMRGIELCRKHGVEFNTLTVVNHHNSKHPLRAYNFLKNIGSTFHQYIPLVERIHDNHASTLSGPPTLKNIEDQLAPWSVRADDYGQFLCTIFDAWVQQDVGSTFVQLFDVMLGIWAQGHGGLCMFGPTCGSALAIEHNGDVYSCDHYVYPEYLLGNIQEHSLSDLANRPQQHRFGDAKAQLPHYCQHCDVRFACHGECPKHRFAVTPDGEPGLNYLCPAYKRFLKHIDPAMQQMTSLLQRGMPPALIMPGYHQRQKAAIPAQKSGEMTPVPATQDANTNAAAGVNLLIANKLEASVAHVDLSGYTYPDRSGDASCPGKATVHNPPTPNTNLATTPSSSPKPIRGV